MIALRCKEYMKGGRPSSKSRNNDTACYYFRICCILGQIKMSNNKNPLKGLTPLADDEKLDGLFPPDRTSKGFGKRLSDKRKEKGMTQEQLAEKIHVSRSTLANFETGTMPRDVQTIHAIVEALDTDFNYLFGGVNEEDFPLSIEAWDKLNDVRMTDTNWEAVNFFLSQEEGLGILASLYLYMTSNTLTARIDGSNRKIDPNKIYFYVGEDIAEQWTFKFHPAEYDYMHLMAIFEQIREWKKSYKHQSNEERKEDD